MSKVSKYVSHPSDAEGFIAWSEEENAIWADLYARQIAIIQNRACDQFMRGLELLNLPKDKVPQLNDINRVLLAQTGWQVSEVPALIPFEEFFRLLANKQFPVATFIRTREDFDYLQEPDIFHEIFGHCPLLTNSAFANFTHIYGKLGYAASKEDRVFLARLYWFTVEFGLLNTDQGTRIYGGGILSSPGETVYALESDKPERKTFDPIEVLRTPYRIDIMQPVYYVLKQADDLDALADQDLMGMVEQAKALGLHAPKFPPKSKAVS